MRRPLALIGLTAMIVLAVCFYADCSYISIIFALSAVGFILSLAVKKLRKLVTPTVFFATVLLAVTSFGLFSQLYVKPLEDKFVGVDAEISAVLIEEGKYHNGSYFYELKAKNVNAEKVDFKIMLYSKDAVMCDIGDTLSFKSEMFQTDYSRYRADAIFLGAQVFDGNEVKVTKAETRPFYYYIVELRDKIRTALYMELNYTPASLAVAVLLGDNSGFTDELTEVMRRAGLSHVAVVSGLHLSIITLIYQNLIGKRIKNKYINAAVTALIVLFFLCLTGFGKSSIRAAFMLFVLMTARLFKRRHDSLTSLGLAAIILCMVNPYVAGDIGVLLSFSATFGIVTFAKDLEKFLTRRLMPVDESSHPKINTFVRYVAALFSTSFTAIVATLPVMVLFFGKASLVQLFSNLLVLSLVQWFMLMACFAAVFYYVPFLGVITNAFAFAADLIGGVMIDIASFFASLPMAYVKADYGFVFLWIFASIVLFALAYYLKRRGRGLRLLCASLSVLILLSGMVGNALAYRNTLTVYVTKSDKGQGIVLSSKDGNVALVCSQDSYASREIIDVLGTLYNENTLMVVSSDSEAEQNAIEVLDEFDYERVLMYDTEEGNEYAKSVMESGRELSVINGSFNVNLWDKAELFITEREEQVYMYLTFGGTSVLLLPSSGDVQDIPENMRSADILVASGMIENMELLEFSTLVSNGSYFKRVAVLDYYRNRSGNKISVEETINFDIAG